MGSAGPVDLTGRGDPFAGEAVEQGMTKTTKTLSALVERVAEAIGGATFLDPAAQAGSKLTDLIPRGPVKDLLSGTDAGHPVHPALVAVPIGTFTGAVFLDLTGGDAAASRRLIGLGLASSVPTVAAGLSDWGDTQGDERRVGVAHALSNAVGLGLMAASWVRRGSGGGSGGGKALALAGMGAIGLGGWLGGHLSYALGVGVDTTAFQKPPTAWTDACSEFDLRGSSPYVVTVEDTPVMLIRHDGELRALNNRCTHRGGPLSEGEVVDGCIECPWHGSRFSLDDGSVARGPASRPAPTFETRIVEGRVQVRRQESRALRTNPVS